MTSQFYVVSVNGKFVGDRYFTSVPFVGDVVMIQGQPVKIVEVRRSIGIILAEAA